MVSILASPSLISVHSAEPSLTTILDNLGFTNRTVSSNQTFSAGTYNITLYAEFAGYFNENELSYYQVGTSVYNVIFTGPEGANASGYVVPPLTKTFSISYQFGFSLFSGDGHRYYTEKSRNPDNLQHAKVYENLDVPGMCFIGFENLYGYQGDRDYNDMVFALKPCPPPPPTLSVSISPTPVTMNLGQSVTFNSNVSGGTPTYSYQWYLNNTAFPGANASTWTFTPNSTGFYTVYLNVTDSLNATAKSNIASVTVNPALSVSISPTSVTIDLNQSKTFNSTVSGGTLPYRYQWYSNNTAFPGANASTWTFTPASAGFYTVYLNVTDNINATAKSNIANVTVNPTLSVSISPTSVTIDLGQSVTFQSTVAGGTSPYFYQWYLNGTKVSGATNPNWTFTPNSTGFYRVYLNVSDSAQVDPFAISNTANVTVNLQLTVSISPPSTTITFGQSVLFSATVSGGTSPYSYAWDVNGTWIQGETNSTFNFTPNQTGYYNISLLVTDSAGVNASAFASVTVQVPKYYLTVQTDPANITNISGENWYDNCTYVTLTAPQFVPNATGVNGQRYRFANWTVNGEAFMTLNITVHMDANHTAIAHYVLQYLVTFAQTGLDNTANNTVVIINGVLKSYGDLPNSTWFDSGSLITYSYYNVSSTDSGKRFVLVNVTGPVSSFVVTGSVTITGNYKTQYEVTFDQSGVGTDFTGTVVTIDGTGYGVGNLSKSFWWDENSNHNFSFASPLVVNAGKQYNWTSTSGLSTRQNDTLTITGSGSVTGNYSTGVKYQITFNQTGVNSDFNDTIVIIDGTPYNRTTLPVSFWWDNGTTHTFAFQSPLVVTPNAKRYVWNSTIGLSSLQNNSITVSTSGSIIGNYKTQYYLTTSTNFGTVAPSSGWRDAGSTVQISASPPSVVDGEQYVWLGWSGSGNGNYTGMNNPANITMNSPITETASWRHEYRLIMNTNFGTTNPSVGEHWYEAGSTVEINATAPSVISGEQYVWLGWTGTGNGNYSGMANPANLTMNGPITETAAWRHEYYLTVNSPHDSPTPTSGWFEAGQSIIASVTSPVSAPSGTRYVCTGWTGNGSVPPSGLTTSVTFTINAPSSITWIWKTQYLLTVRTDPTGLNPQPTRSPAGEAGQGGWWYDSSTSVNLTAQLVTNYDFLNWDVDGTSQGSKVNPINVTMNGSHVATAHYEWVTPPAVGGYTAPIDLGIGKEASHLLASQIGLAFALLAAMAVTILLTKRRSKTLK